MAREYLNNKIIGFAVLVETEDGPRVYASTAVDEARIVFRLEHPVMQSQSDILDIPELVRYEAVLVGSALTIMQAAGNRAVRDALGGHGRLLATPAPPT